MTLPTQGPFKQVLGPDDVRRAITRMAHEIIERNRLGEARTDNAASEDRAGHNADVATARAPDLDAALDPGARDAAREVVLVGLQRGGVWLAEALAADIAKFAVEVPVGSIDVSLYRDDIGLRPISPGSVSDLPFAVEGATIVLVDDVLYTGRTIKAALDALTDYGRPRSVQLAVLVDRGHRELPIRPDVVGKNLPTSSHEKVTASPDGVVIGTMVEPTNS